MAGNTQAASSDNSARLLVFIASSLMLIAAVLIWLGVPTQIMARAGFPDAQNKPGDRCRTRSDYTQAVKWYRLAAARGHQLAKEALVRLES